MISVVQTALFKRLPADKVGITHPFKDRSWFKKAQHCTQNQIGCAVRFRTGAGSSGRHAAIGKPPYSERAPLGGGGFAHGPEW